MGRPASAAHLGQFIHLYLKSHALALSAKMLSVYSANNCKEPGLERPFGLVSMPGLVDCDHGFLTDILKSGIIRNAPAQKTLNYRPHIFKKTVEGLAVSTLGPLHKPPPAYAV